MPLEPGYSDGKLLQLLSQDSEQAFDELYNRYWKKLFVIAMHTLKEVEQAEEIVHDVLLKLWKLRSTLIIEKNLDSYLAAAVKYHVLNHLRKQNRRAQLLEDKKSEEIFNEDPTGNWLRERELMQELQKGIDLLPERCRLVYRLSREEGLSTTEISNQLNVSVNTVESQLSKSLKHLRVYFKDKLGMYLFF